MSDIIPEDWIKLRDGLVIFLVLPHQMLHCLVHSLVRSSDSLSPGYVVQHQRQLHCSLSSLLVGCSELLYTANGAYRGVIHPLQCMM